MQVFASPRLIFASVAAVSVLSSLVCGMIRNVDSDSISSILGNQDLGPWQNGFFEAARAPGPGNNGPESTLVLAANRTNRPDILRGFRWYHGGWDIRNRHYWASVGFTGAASFIIAALWLISFGVVLILHHFFGWRINIKGKESNRSQKIYLILLVIFTSIAVSGCIVLSFGQDRFHDEALHALNYVINQSDYTVQTLRNVTGYLVLAKTIDVAEIYLPSNVKDDIDKLNVELDTAADTLTEKTSENSEKIRKVFNDVQLALVTVSAVMLVLSLLGLFLSVFGHGHAIHIFIVGGWLLVAGTFLLCGFFTILNNAVTDTCMAMEEWVDNPHAETALSSILSCVDQRTTNHTLVQSKQVITNVVGIVNEVIYTVANTDPPEGDPKYYNQSGPLMPPLCYPFNYQLQDQQCGDLEVSLSNAPEVWQNYTCSVSAFGLCNGVGRVTPTIYEQLLGAVTISYALEHYAPPLLSLQNCNFVSDTFRELASSYCPPLENNLGMINAGLGLISGGVLLCLVQWIFILNRPEGEISEATHLNIWQRWLGK